MRLIDDDGYVGGRVNIIDALAVLFVGAVVLAGLGVVTGFGSSPPPTQTVVVETEKLPSYVVDSIEEGPSPSNNVVRVDNVTVRSPGSNTSRVRLRVTLVVRQSSDGLPKYRDRRLFVGRTIQLDLGETIVRGAVVDMERLSTEE